MRRARARREGKRYATFLEGSRAFAAGVTENPHIDGWRHMAWENGWKWGQLQALEAGT